MRNDMITWMVMQERYGKKWLSFKVLSQRFCGESEVNLIQDSYYRAMNQAKYLLSVAGWKFSYMWNLTSTFKKFVPYSVLT